MGGYLLVDAAITLVEAEHPTIGGVAVFGQVVWLGWMMLLPLLWSTLPSVFLARAKLPLADRLHDKILLADAEMAKADWMTGAAAMLGLGGLALGYWWADAAAGALISLDILRDGCRYVATAAHDLMDRRPQRLLDLAPDPLPEQLARTLEELDWVEAAAVRLREDGHLFSGEAFVVPRDDRDLIERINAAAKQACASDWRLRELVITPVRHLPPWA
jgi:divalent metal cation (Fe/Co/Zn/Cd) transporter